VAELQPSDVVVRVTMKDGRRCESPLMPGVIASAFQHAIEVRRDNALNAERVPIPEPTKWLLDCFDFSEVAEVGTEYRGSRERARRDETG
jgi:hypothetical protein